MDCLFESFKQYKNADPDKHVCSGYGFRFNSRLKFWLLDGSVIKNFIIFGADMNSSVHINNKRKEMFLVKFQHKE